jgi:hypothetical protein
MTKLILVLTLGLGSITGRGQSILDLTEQIAFDAQKLGSLKSTLQEMVQGYNQLKTGYTHIRDIARDNFNLHQAFLDALWVLSPAVRSDPRLTTIVNTTNRIVAEWRNGTARVSGTPLFTAQELNYITGTLSALMTRCNQDLEELAMVTTDNELRMSDDQRLQALDRIDSQLKAELSFLQQFNNSLALEAARRQKEAGDIHTLKRLYGLPD